jgi:LysM repeat protein
MSDFASFFSSISSLFQPSKEVQAKEVPKAPEQTLYLRAAVNIDPNTGKGGGDINVVGGVALLPETGPSGSIADIAESAHSDQISLYIVRKGDTLSGIASMFGVSTNTVLWANDLTRSSTLKEGQSLIILPISGIRYTVKKGDTIAGIAKTYKAELSDILAFNEITAGSTLTTGQVVIIPNGVEAAPVAPTPTTSKLRASGGVDLGGFFLYPVPNGIRTQGLHGYNGIDIGAKTGTPILAAASGTVIVSRNFGYNGGYGQYVVIQHANGVQTLYAHMSQNAVTVGDIVSQAQVIGYVGATGRSTGAHLHFEVRGAKNPF